MFHIHGIKDDSDPSLIKFLKQGLKQVNESNLIENYHPDYSSNLGNLFYVLKSGRFLKGNYFIIKHEDQYVGSAGWNPYQTESNESVALALTRAYVIPLYRNQYILAKYILPKVLEESSGYQKVWITANEYNKIIYDSFIKMADRRTPGLFNMWPEIYSRFKPIGKHIVNSAEQYVVEYNRIL